MLKTLKILFYFAAVLFIGKPFLGFSLLDRNQKQEQELSCILLGKLFSKRKSADVEDEFLGSTAILQRSSVSQTAAQKKIPDPAQLQNVLPLVNTGFPASLLKSLRLSLPGKGETYLLAMNFRL